MKPKTLSASAIKTFEACPAYFRAKYIQKAPDPPGDPALRGSAVHGALEEWVAGGWHMSDLPKLEAEAKMVEMVERNYWQLLAHGNELQFCIDQSLRWLERTDFSDRTVLMTETKMRFDLPTSAGKIPVSYIFDRLDDLGNDVFEVTDYKTWVRNISAAHLRWDIQARIYALAAWIAHQHAKRVWVTFDQTRYMDIGAAFTAEDSKATWRYLKDVAERILASDGTEETLNSECRFCPRKRVCTQMKRHARVGGELSFNDIDEAVKLRHETAAQIKALEVMVNDVDTFVLAHADAEAVDEFEASEIEVAITSRKTRSIDQSKLVGILGPDTAYFVQEYGGLTVSAVSKYLKNPGGEFPADMHDQISALVDSKYAGLSVNTEALSPILLAT